MDPEMKALLDQQAKTFEQFKAANDSMQAEIKKLGTADTTTAEKVEKLNAKLDQLDEAKAALEKRTEEIEKKANRPGVGHNGGPALEFEAELKAFNIERKSVASAKGGPAPSDEVDADGYRGYKAAFGKMLRKGNMDMLSQDERKAMQVGVDSDGGYLVPADVTGRIVKRIYETSPIRQIASAQTISTDSLEGIDDLDEGGDIQWVSETQTRSETATPQIGKWSIPVHEAAAEPKATQKLLDDAAVDVEGWLANKVADRFARGENKQFVIGNGIGKPRGFTDYTSAATADGTRAWGVLEHISTGVNSAFAAANPADILFDLIGAFKDAYLQNGRFVTRREVITLVRKFKESTTGNYLWQPGLQQGQPQMLLGFPVTIAQDMPALGAGSKSLAFGDFREGYQIVDRIGLRTLRDPYTAKPYVKFYTTKRVGGGVLNFEAIKFVRFGT